MCEFEPPKAAAQFAEHLLREMESNISQLTVDELKDFLLQKGVDEKVVCDLQRNRVSGQSFVKFTDLKELVPLVGVRTTICHILQECQRFSTF